ncbi:probable methyltransferase-like protein 15 homolog [Daktulosphaira vitifoliae]|uniref:probable methyltransferase-like protein 15 homolog n=1 Tax=Daktulosphaira vitifoliae TaxID=58002 RepID=UPI0021AA7803|nr:probable methyltransferase-like protein 15 homolog [Daktulosphaira vitifoliae]
MKVLFRQPFPNLKINSSRMLRNQSHKPVMLEQAIKYLNPKNGHNFLDMTFGAGGHTERILQENNSAVVYCLDRDPTAYSIAQKFSLQYPNRVVSLKGKFSDLPTLLKKFDCKMNSFDGILFDFGASSMQFDTASRGFAISKNGPLDMRMDPEENILTAADILAKADQTDLYKIFKIYGEEKHSKKIANAIIESRYLFRPLKTTYDLCELVKNVCDNEKRFDMLHRLAHPATKIFQALRIFVNNELNEINHGIILANHYLKIGGIMVTIAFHSLEDTIVKRHIQGNVNENVANVLPLKYKTSPIHMNSSNDFLNVINDNCWHQVNKHVVTPTIDEVEENPRSRSARLRAAIKIK